MLASLVDASVSDGIAASVMRQIQDVSGIVSEGLNLLISSLTPLADQTDVSGGDQGKLVYRFEQGVVPDSLREQASRMILPTQEMVQQLLMLSDWLQEGMEGKRSDIAKPDAEAWMPVMATQLARAEAVLSVWMRYQQSDEDDKAPCARWLEFSQSGQGLDVELAACPVLASDVLARYLWNRAFAAIVTSATITALGKFDRFRFRSGVPINSSVSVVPSPFDYAQSGVVRVPDLACDPVNAVQHSNNIARFINQGWDEVRGTLVLFSSRRQMEEVYELIKEGLEDKVLMQTRLSKAEMIRRHKQRVDGGDHSVLFGLASFAEGVDLPGEYCQRVIIVRLPFSVPEDPVDATLAEWIQKQGGNPFMQISVPDAAIRLNQAAGRLLRTEQDQGEIVILDRRIIDKRYGRLLLDSLPPFPLKRA